MVVCTWNPSPGRQMEPWGLLASLFNQISEFCKISYSRLCLKNWGKEQSQRTSHVHLWPIHMGTWFIYTHMQAHMHTNLHAHTYITHICKDEIVEWVLYLTNSAPPGVTRNYIKNIYKCGKQEDWKHRDKKKQPWSSGGLPSILCLETFPVLDDCYQVVKLNRLIIVSVKFFHGRQQKQIWVNWSRNLLKDTGWLNLRVRWKLKEIKRTQETETKVSMVESKRSQSHQDLASAVNQSATMDLSTQIKLYGINFWYFSVALKFTLWWGRLVTLIEVPSEVNCLLGDTWFHIKTFLLTILEWHRWVVTTRDTARHPTLHRIHNAFL